MMNERVQLWISHMNETLLEPVSCSQATLFLNNDASVPVLSWEDAEKLMIQETGPIVWT